MSDVRCLPAISTYFLLMSHIYQSAWHFLIYRMNQDGISDWFHQNTQHKGLSSLDILSYFCHRHWMWHSDLLNRELQSHFQMKNFRLVTTIFFFHNNFSLGKGSTIRGSKNLNATFNVGGKNNWVRLVSRWKKKKYPEDHHSP